MSALSTLKANLRQNLVLYLAGSGIVSVMSVSAPKIWSGLSLNFSNINWMYSWDRFHFRRYLELISRNGIILVFCLQLIYRSSLNMRFVAKIRLLGMMIPTAYFTVHLLYLARCIFNHRRHIRMIGWNLLLFPYITSLGQLLMERKPVSFSVGCLINMAMNVRLHGSDSYDNKS